MEFKFRATGDEPSSYDPPPPPPLRPPQPHSSLGLSYFADHPLRAGYICPDVGRVGDYFPNPCCVPESVLRELEKQQIRKEIIAAEVERRRQLEAEVRAEMMIERQMALRGAHANDFSMFSGSSTMPKMDENISGMKRKAVMPPPTTTTTMPLNNSIKKPKGLLQCELCQIFATSEEALKEHFQGKKHKSRESRQSSQIPDKNFVIGMFSRKAISNPSKLVAITGSESLILEEKPKDEVFQKKLDEEQKNNDKILQLDENSEEDIKNDDGESEKVEKDSLRFSFQKWKYGEKMESLQGDDEVADLGWKQRF